MTTSNPNINFLYPVADARAIVDAHIHRVDSERIPVTEAAGRILAEDVVAPIDFPPFAASIMDGFAVLAADESPWREILGAQHAGFVLDVEVTEGTAVRIMTGAPLPPGANAVVKVENTELMDDHVVIKQDVVEPGEHIREIGSDIRKGELVLAKGTRIGPAELGVLCQLGITPVSVARKLRVSVLSTGDELLEPDEDLKPGQIRDSNRFSLATQLADEPVEITFIGKAPDDREQLDAFVHQRLAEDDIVLTSGGVSMGDKDYLKAILFDSPDIDLHFRQVFMRPGKAINFATYEDRSLFFGVPGNPMSAMVCFELFVRPAIRQMIGDLVVDRPTVPVVLEDAIGVSPRTEYHLAVVTVGPDGSLMARSTGFQRSSRLVSHLGANAYLVLDVRDERYEPGELVPAIMLGAPVAR